MEKERYLKYVKICERAERMKIDTGDRMGALMDIESADKKFNMRLDDWLQADDFNFAHDYCGRGLPEETERVVMQIRGA